MRFVTAGGILCLITSAWLVWIAAPIRGQLAEDGYFGWIGVLVGVTAGVAWLCRSHKLCAVCGVTGLGLSSFAVLHLTFMNATFWSLVDENAQYAQIMQFSSHYLPANLGIEPTFEPNLSTRTVLDALGTAAYFMSWGWWMCLIGSLLVLTGGYKVGGKATRRWVAMAVLVLLAGQGGLLLRGFAAQYLLEQGDRHMARGRYAEAMQQYEAAQRFTPLLAKHEQIHLRIGEAAYQLKGPAHPAGSFYLGDRYAQQRRPEAATAEYLLAAQAAGAPLQEIIHKRLAWTYVGLGLTEYRRGEVGPAVGQWERALAIDPAQFQAAYFLVRAYFEQGRYEQSIAVGRFLLSRSRNQLLHAHVQANIGDGYWRLDKLNEARRAYEISRKLDKVSNFRIFKSLGGT